MNKRLPLLLSLLALILLAVSIAYWVLQLYRPEQRPLAAAPLAGQAEPSPDAAATLFGGQPSVAAISNFQLTGVVAAGANSAVIIVADGAPPQAVRVGREVAPGVVVAEVHPRYVMLSEGGVMKRVELAPDTKSAPGMGGGEMAPPGPPMPVPVAAQPAPGVEPPMAPGVVSAPPNMQGGNPGVQSVPPPGGGPTGTPTTPEGSQVVPEPQMDPQAGDPNQPPPPNQVQMPPPTRSVNSPVGQNATTQ